MQTENPTTPPPPSPAPPDQTTENGTTEVKEVLMDYDEPCELSREFISEKTGYTRRTRDAYLLNMVHKEIVQVTKQGHVIASKLLFDSI